MIDERLTAVGLVADVARRDGQARPLRARGVRASGHVRPIDGGRGTVGPLESLHPARKLERVLLEAPLRERHRARAEPVRTAASRKHTSDMAQGPGAVGARSGVLSPAVVGPD